LSGDSLTAYTNGVALVDRVVGELRAAMEQSGAWNTTTLLISSDHFYRASQLVNGKRDERVPFIVHLPGQTSGLTYTHSFNTVVTHDFILALLRSEITDPASVEHWLDRHNSD
jgi:arylsulfatase A-like enzyme